MRRAGQLALLRFPRAGLQPGKLRPVLLVRPVPGPYDDWLVCMVSSQLRQEVPAFDEAVGPSDPDFAGSGLRTASVLRLSRLAVVESSALVGSIGEIGPERLARVWARLAAWMSGTSS